MNPRQLTDDLLELEILLAERWAAASAKDMRTARHNISDAGAQDLIEANANACAYLSELISERARRQNTGRYAPGHKAVTVEQVSKPHAPQPPQPVEPANKTNAKPVPRTAVRDEEPEQVPIIVFENGFPRAWRSGDPIHKKKM